LTLEDFFGLSAVEKRWFSRSRTQGFQHLAEEGVADELVKGIG